MDVPTEQPWLWVDGQPVAPLEVADGPAARGRGLLGRDAIVGALLLTPCRSVHTWAMRFAIDIAQCDADGLVLAVHVAVPPGRVVLPRRRTRFVVEAAAGAFDRWGLTPGVRCLPAPPPSAR